MKTKCQNDTIQAMDMCNALGSICSYTNNVLSLLTVSLLLLSLVGGVHSSGEVPHLNAAVAMPSKEVPPWSRTHPARTLALPHRETRDGGPIHCRHLTDPCGDKQDRPHQTATDRN